MISTPRLRPEDLFELKFLRGAQLSPDGRQVAYAVSTTDSVEHLQIWLYDLRRDEERLLPYTGNATKPRWSPDGDRIAFVGDERLYVASLRTATISEALTPSHLTVQGVPSWSPDGTRLAVSLQERRLVAGPKRISTSVYRADGLGYLQEIDQGIYEVSPEGVRLRRLTPSASMCLQPQWSPCGERILFLSGDEAVPFASYSPKLLVLSLRDGTVSEVLGADWFITCARWLPGGERIVVAGAYDSTLTVPTVAVWTIDCNGRNPQLRTPELKGNVGCRIHHDMPAWDLTQDNVLSVIDDSTVYASIQRGGSVEIWRIALEGEISMTATMTGDRACFVLDAHPASDTLLFAATDVRSPPELWLTGLEGNYARRLTALNDEVLSAWPKLELTPLPFQSADGLELEGWFLAPEFHQGALPTILYIHGGPFGATGHAFRYDLSLLASQGYGVLFANFRGSAGYGDAFSRLIMGDWGGRGFPDHMATVDAAVARGLADPQRLGVWGASHGGFATCWIIGHTHRFKAAVAEAAVTNFATLYYLSDAPESFRRDLGGRPHEIPEVYSERSPITYAHRCRTPTLLVHGENDLRCPISEAEQFYRVLKDVGCATELLRIPECSHLGDSIGPLEARRAQNEALLSWFGKHLGSTKRV